MLSDKCVLTVAEAMGPAFDVALAWELPFGIPQYVKCMEFN